MSSMRIINDDKDLYSVKEFDIDRVDVREYKIVKGKLIKKTKEEIEKENQEVENKKQVIEGYKNVFMDDTKPVEERLENLINFLKEKGII